VNARLFEELRPIGFAVAYRMLGSVSEAEDIVQEAFLRLHRTLQDGERIESPRAYLSTVVTRLCINHLRSARARHQTYVEALPEPLVGEPGAAMPLVPASGPAGVADAGDPASHAEMADSLSLAFLVLLETLSPEQRAAFLLREVFDYPYDQIAAIVATSEQNARQLVARPGATSSSDGPASSHRASKGSAWPDGSSPPPRTATSAGSRSCWPTT
jgi:RNA polymerase sigma-70 factor (ECF subfamily)